MKKLPSVIIFFVCFTGVLGLQVSMDLLDISASPGSSKKKRISHYENIFKEASFDTIGHGRIKLSELGSRIVILNFWASWCAPCLSEFASLNKLNEEFKDQITIIGINGDSKDQKQNIRKAIDKHRLRFPVVADPPSGPIYQQFLISAIPSSIIFKDGEVIEIGQGAYDFSSEELLETFREILAE